MSITGNGMKTLEAVQNDLVQPKVIEGKLSEFDELLKSNGHAEPALAASGSV